jgi:O-antigen ligase
MISTELHNQEVFRERKPFALLAQSVTFAMALAFVFVIPMEGAVIVPGLGKLSRIVGLLLAASWFFSFLVFGRTRTPKPFHLFAFAFVGWNVLSLFWSQDLPRSTERVSTYLQIAIMLVIIWDVFTSQARLRIGLQTYLFGSLAAAFSTIYNYLNADEFYYQRFAAAGLHVDDLGINLGLAIPIAWYLATSLDAKTGYARLLKAVNFIAIPLLTFAIFLTGTRAALLASAPAFLYMGVSLLRLPGTLRILSLGMMICSLIAVIPFIPASSWERMGTIGTEITEGDLNGRMGLWRSGLLVFSEHPILGSGTNSFPVATGADQVAHNTFISVLTETGLVGFGFMIAVMALTIRSGWSRPFWERLFWFSLLAVLLIGISTLTWEHRKPTWLMFSFVVIAGACESRRQNLFAPTRWQEHQSAKITSDDVAVDHG